MGIVSNREHMSKGTTDVQGIVASLVLPDLLGFPENRQILDFFKKIASKFTNGKVSL